MKKILIVGAGLSSCIIARELALSGYSCLIIDKRDHVGGNIYDHYEDDILVHKYGPHIWHTNDKIVHDYMGQFTKWVDYKHKVKAILEDGTLVTLPANKETAEIIGKDNIIDVLFRPYTKKMWNKEIEELNPDILKRVPSRDDMNELYFPDDKYQGMPDEGYTELIKKMISHENIEVKLNTEFNEYDEADFYHVFNAMPIDEYFNFSDGLLPYRSLKFHKVKLPSPKMLATACVNYTNSSPYTRMTEWKQFPNSSRKSDWTIITYEEPCSYEETSERYYPIKDLENKNFNLYKEYKKKIKSNMTFIGRCGLYKYIDMDDVCKLSLKTAEDFLSNEK